MCSVASYDRARAVEVQRLRGNAQQLFQVASETHSLSLPSVMLRLRERLVYPGGNLLTDKANTARRGLSRT
jgi:hypothetical protein